MLEIWWNLFWWVWDIKDEIGQFFVNLLESEGVLGTVHFAYGALLTLQIPLLIFLFEERRELKKSRPEFVSLDAVIIAENANIKRKFWLIIVAVCILLFWNNDNNTNYWGINLLLLIFALAVYIFLILETIKIVDFLGQSIDQYRINYIKWSGANPESQKNWFEEYFLSDFPKNEGETSDQREIAKVTDQAMVDLFNKNDDVLPALTCGVSG